MGRVDNRLKNTAMPITKQRHGAMPVAGLSFPLADEILTRTQIGVGGFLWSPLNNRLDLTPNLWRILGMDPAFETVRQNLLLFIHPSHRSRARKELRTATSRRETSFEGIYRADTGNSERLRMLLIRAEITYEADLATQVQGVAIDVTSVPRLLLSVGRS